MHNRDERRRITEKVLDNWFAAAKEFVSRGENLTDFIDHTIRASRRLSMSDSHSSVMIGDDLAVLDTGMSMARTAVTDLHPEFAKPREGAKTQFKREAKIVAERILLSHRGPHAGHFRYALQRVAANVLLPALAEGGNKEARRMPYRCFERRIEILRRQHGLVHSKASAPS